MTQPPESSRLSELFPEAANHLPVVAKRNDGDWGVYCLACSDAANDYIYPCRNPHIPADYFPPPVLTPKN